MNAKRILIVDDDALMRAINQRLLEENGFEVAVALDGPTALRMIPTFRPDLVLLDVIMPNVNGYRIARMIKTLVAHAHIRVPKIILLTGRRMNSIRSQDLLEFSKADRMMFKPYNPVILISTIESVLAGEKPHLTTA